MNCNVVLIAGNLTRDPELKNTPSGMAVCQFSIAVNHKYKGKDGQLVEEVSFIKITTWGKTAENCASHLAKGSNVCVEGRLKQETWEKDGKKNEKTGVVADRVHFVGARKEKSGAAAESSGEETPF